MRFLIRPVSYGFEDAVPATEHSVPQRDTFHFAIICITSLLKTVWRIWHANAF